MSAPRPLLAATVADLNRAYLWREAALARLEPLEPVLEEALAGMPVSLERVTLRRARAELLDTANELRRALREIELAIADKRAAAAGR